MPASEAANGRTEPEHGPLGFLRRMFRTTERAPMPIIGVGSIIVGGSRRVPLVRAVVRRLTALGQAPHILSGGEGGRQRGPQRVDPMQQTSRDVGDDAIRLSADAPTWVARDLRAGIHAVTDAKAGLVVVDNRLRDTSVQKDLTFLAAAGDPDDGNIALPAAERWQELPDGIGRADVLVLIGPGSGGHLQELAERGGLTVLRANLLALNALELVGRPLVAFAGIAQPQKMFRLLRDAGADIVVEIPFPDHHPYEQADWDRLTRLAETAGAELVTTENDAVRLPAEWRRRAWVLRTELHFDDEPALDHLLSGIQRVGTVL